MALSTRFMMAGASLSMVFTIGFIMQHGAEAPSSIRAELRSEASMPEPLALSDITLTVGAPDPADSTVTDVVAADPAPVRLAAATPMAMDPAPDTPALQQPQLTCDPELTAETLPAAMVQLDLSAPCLMNQRVTLHHNGMMFTTMTGEDGALQVKVPALSETSVFIADFGNGEGAVAHATVPELAQFDRAVAQWRGDLGLELHALEYGAGYGEVGHIWAAAPGVEEAARRGLGGFLIRLGDFDLTDGYRAEVYTFPSGAAGHAGDVRLSVETELTAQNCTRDIQAESLQLTAGTGLVVRELTLAMPGCDTLGDFLVLNNLLQDLKIAAN